MPAPTSLPTASGSRISSIPQRKNFGSQSRWGLAALDRNILIWRRVGVAGQQPEAGFRDPRSDPVEEAQQPHRRVDRPLVGELLHLVQDCGAFFVVELDRLLLEHL